MNGHAQMFKVAANHITSEMHLSLYQIMWICYSLESVKETVAKDIDKFICVELDGLRQIDRDTINMARRYVAISMNHSSSEEVCTVEHWLEVNGYEEYTQAQAHKVRQEFLQNMIDELTRVLKEYKYPF